MLENKIITDEEIELYKKALRHYESKIVDWKKHSSLDGKNIAVANVDQVSWLSYYDEMKVDVRYYIEKLEHKLKKQKAVAIKAIYQTMQKSITDRMVDKLSEENPTYEEIFEIYLEFKNLYDRLDMIVGVFKQRAFSLNNLVKIMEANMEGITLHL